MPKNSKNQNAPAAATAAVAVASRLKSLSAPLTNNTMAEGEVGGEQPTRGVITRPPTTH